MADRGLELRQLGALSRELGEAARWDDVVFVDECLRAGTFDMPMPAHLIEKLRGLWETSKASKRDWRTAPSAEATSEASTIQAAPPSPRLH